MKLHSGPIGCDFLLLRFCSISHILLNIDTGLQFESLNVWERAVRRIKSWKIRSGFFSASGKFSSNSELYIEKAPLHIGVIVHQIKKYIEVASMCPYLEQKTTTA